MRDRESDSWWSIMSSTAIGGELEGEELVELPVGEKTTWGAWVDRFPHSLVLSVDGVEHLESNPYEAYFASDETFRGLEVDDSRLPPKEPVFAFLAGGRAYAAPHAAIEGGRLFRLPDSDGRAVLLYREPQAALLDSSRAYWLDGGTLELSRPPHELLAAAAAAAEGSEPLGGIDTFWYTWVAIHRHTQLLR